MKRSQSHKGVAMAGGEPLDSHVADEAADWLTLVMSGEANEATWARLQVWREADPDHERAWRHIEAVIGRFRVVDGNAGYRALSPYADLGCAQRRKVLSLLFYGGALGTAALLTTRTQRWQAAVADYRTSTGEQRQVSLGDGTRILLNTASAIDVRFDGQLRLVRLVAGEIRVVTGHDTPASGGSLPPFVVETREGRIRALGTRFTVRQEDQATVVTVQESAVEITPAELPQARVPLHEQQRIVFTRREIGENTPLNDQELAWVRGQIVADNLRLGDFISELARYRPGIIRCDPAAAALRFSGVFPLKDTDAILDTLPTVLAVSVRRRTRYWVTVESRA